jgi:hypothetical protein
MYRFVFIFSVFWFCSAGAVDKEPFKEIVDSFKSGDYLKVVSRAMDFIRDDSNKFKNDSNFFLRTFFGCMLNEDERLKPFSQDVVLQYNDADENKLGYYSDYQTMMMVFEYLAMKKFESTKNDFWNNVPNPERELYIYSDSDEEFAFEEDEGDFEESVRFITSGTEIGLDEIIRIARSNT